MREAADRDLPRQLDRGESRAGCRSSARAPSPTSHLSLEPPPSKARPHELLLPRTCSLALASVNVEPRGRTDRLSSPVAVLSQSCSCEGSCALQGKSRRFHPLEQPLLARVRALRGPGFDARLPLTHSASRAERATSAGARERSSAGQIASSLLALSSSRRQARALYTRTGAHTTHCEPSAARRADLALVLLVPPHPAALSLPRPPHPQAAFRSALHWRLPTRPRRTRRRATRLLRVPTSNRTPRSRATTWAAHTSTATRTLPATASPTRCSRGTSPTTRGRRRASPLSPSRTTLLEPSR